MKFKIQLGKEWRFISLALVLLAATCQAEDKPKQKGYGSGAIISPKGLIVTCAHVVNKGHKLSVYSENRKHDAELLEVINDRGQDLALLRCPDLEGKPFLAIKPSGTIKPGETVFAMGFPESDVLGKEIKITKGEISSKNGYKNDSNIWQTSADIHPGSSGGPFLDEWGRLIGVASAYIPEERISYSTKAQLLLDGSEAYLSEMKITPPEGIPHADSGLATHLWKLMSGRKKTKQTMSQIRESSAEKVVVVCVE